MSPRCLTASSLFCATVCLASAQPSYAQALMSVSISGPTLVQDNSTAQYTATAHFDVGDLNVTAYAVWSVTPNDHASIVAGVMTVQTLAATEQVGVNITYTAFGTTRSASQPVTLTRRTCSPCIYQWSPIGVGVVDSDILAMATVPYGSVEDLYISGVFASIGGIQASGIARWDGRQWNPVGTGFAYPGASGLIAFDDGNGPALYAAGSIALCQTCERRGLAKWNGQTWVLLGPVDLNLFSPDGTAMMPFDDGTGVALYIAGPQSLLKWNGTQLTQVFPSGFGGQRAMVVADLGIGPRLFVAGSSIPGIYSNVAEFDGYAWSPLGLGPQGLVEALAVFDDGHGPALYAGGRFNVADTSTALYIARWNGSQWSSVGGGMTSPAGQTPSVHALATFDDGTGLALYASGKFERAGGIVVNSIGKWNGTAWSPVGSGANSQSSDGLLLLRPFDDGKGPALTSFGHGVGVGGLAAGILPQWGCATVLGDADGSGVRDGNDIGLFVNIMLNPDSATGAQCIAADVNRDGFIDGNDVQAFVNRLLSR